MRIAALVSGGVDSTVMVHLLAQKGFSPHLFYIAIGPNTNFDGYDCKMEEDVELSRLVAARYGFEFDVVSLHEEYWDLVVRYHADSLRRGLTPNPDLLCNQLIKFGAFDDKYGKAFDYTATGHYATILERNGASLLGTAADVHKDQTYFLAQINAMQLTRIMFPIGHLTKPEVREIARQNGIPTAERKDSQGICFIGRNNYNDFVFHLLGENPGAIIDKSSGIVMGEHNGHWFHTIGQRKGLGLSGGPWFVVDKDIEKNIVFIDKGYNPESVYGKEVKLSSFHAMAPESFIENEVSFKIRHSPQFTKGILSKDSNGFRLISDEKLHGIAPGQFAVIYNRQAEFVIGSGVIMR